MELKLNLTSILEKETIFTNMDILPALAINALYKNVANNTHFHDCRETHIWDPYGLWCTFMHDLVLPK